MISTKQKLGIILSRLGLMLTLIPFISLQGCNLQGNYGAETPDRVINQYILALENRDEALMRQLIPKEYSAEQAVEEKIARLGGSKVENLKVTYLEPKTVFKTARLQGYSVRNNGERQKFEDTLTIAYRGVSRDRGRWFLLLGNGNAAPNKVQPAEPQISPP